MASFDLSTLIFTIYIFQSTFNCLVDNNSNYYDVIIITIIIIILIGLAVYLLFQLAIKWECRLQSSDISQPKRRSTVEQLHHKRDTDRNRTLYT